MGQQYDNELLGVNAEQHMGQYGNVSRASANTLYKKYVSWMGDTNPKEKVLSFKEWMNWAKTKGGIFSATGRATTTPVAPPTTNTSTRPTTTSTPKIVVSTTPSSSGGGNSSTTAPKTTPPSGGSSGGGGGGGGPQPEDPTKNLTQVSKTGRYIAWGILIAVGLGLGYAFLGDKKTT